MGKPLESHSPDGVLIRDVRGLILESQGFTTPGDGTAGYAPGAVFHKLDGTAGAAFLVNDGDEDACDFNSQPATGAVNVAITDTGEFTDAADTEAALAEIYQHLLSAQGGFISIPLGSFREVDSSGDVGAIAVASGNGGQLAADTTPILEADTNEGLRLNWASSNSDIVAVSMSLPPDMDGAADVLIDIIGASASTNNDLAATVLTSWNGGSQVSDSAAAAGGTFTTLHAITATVAAADVPDTPLTLSIQIVPGSHTTDAWYVYGVRVRYKRKLLTA
jgi:hypothetical protein